MKKLLSIFLVAVLLVTTMPTGVFTLTASATSKYTITYYGNGVSGAPTSQIGFTDTPLTLKSMSSNSYVFLGWSPTPYGSVLYNGSGYKFDKDIALYAQWGNHCYYCDDMGIIYYDVYEEVKCSNCAGKGIVNWPFYCCAADCGGLHNYMSRTDSGTYYCRRCGTTGWTKMPKCTDCGGDGRVNDWVTKQKMCSECSGRGYHKTAQVNAPQPELKAKTTTSVTLVAFEGVDYSLNGETWQESNVFDNLKPGTKYTFYMRYRANSIHTIGDAGKSLAVITNCSKHTYTNSCDTSCNVCKSTRTITHSYKTTTTKATLTKNGNMVKKCTVCGKVASNTAIKYVKTFKLSTTTYTYDGKVKAPSVTVKDSAGKTLKKNTDYTVTYASGRKNVGTYKVTVKFKGEYSGSKTLTFTIVPPKTTISKLTAGKKSFTANITKKSTQVTGYQIQYATNKNFTGAVRKTVSSYKSIKHTFKNLKAKKTYYVRVRTFKTVNGKHYYSPYSAYKTIKTK